MVDRVDREPFEGFGAFGAFEAFEAFEVFAARVGQAFEVVTADGSLALALAEVSAAGAAHPGAAPRPFSLLFVGPAAPVLPQQTHSLHHPELGAMEIFLVPIGPGAAGKQAGMRYEAVFN